MSSGHGCHGEPQCFARGVAMAEPGSLKRGSDRHDFQSTFEKNEVRPEVVEHHLHLAYALLSMKMPYNFSSFISRQGKERTKNSFSMGLSYICCAIQHNGEVWWSLEISHQMKTSCSCWDQSLLTSRSPIHKERGKKVEEEKGSRYGQRFRFPVIYVVLQLTIWVAGYR